MTATAVNSELIERIVDAFRADTHVRERLPRGGILNLDRKLPFVIVYRQPPARPDAGTYRLVIGEACYLVGVDEDQAELAELIRALAECATLELGSFLILELWAGPRGSDAFVVHAPAGRLPASVTALTDGLEAMESRELAARVTVQQSAERHPPDLPPLITPQTCYEIGCLSLGLEVPPVYRDPTTDEAYPVFLRRVRALLSNVLRQTFYEFVRVQTNTRFESYQALGPRSVDEGVTTADHELSDIDRSFAFLLLLSPPNVEEAWSTFKAGGYRKTPDFRYRLLPIDPDRLRRRLWAIDLEPVADPALAFLLHDKREELDRQVTMLAERNTPLFRFASMRLYRPVDDALLAVADELIRSLDGVAVRASDHVVTAEEFMRHALAEIAHYRAIVPELATDVQIRPDLTGLMVSDGNLLIGRRLALRPARVAPLIHHEVGTHVLTYYNGRAQPLRQLSTGLADYDELQEGLAVFAEYLVGGLDAARMRVLAARVIAAHSVEQGAAFLDTFRLLAVDHGLRNGTAFDIATRVHASGGFTRDLIYLRGLLCVIEHVRGGGSLEPLFIGKIAVRHIDIMSELRARGFLVEPPLTPRALLHADADARIEAVRRGVPLTEMIASH